MQIACPNCSTTYRVAGTAIGENGRQARCVRCQHVWRVEPETPGSSEATFPAEEAAFDTELGASAPPIAAEPVEPVPVAEDGPPEPLLDDLASQEADGAAASQASDETTAAEPSPIALADIPIPVADAPPLQPEPGDGVSPPPGLAIENEHGDVESVAARREAVGRRRARLRAPLPLLIAAMGIALAALLAMRKEVVRHVPQMASLYSSIGLPVNLRGLEFANLKIGNEIHDGVPVLVIEGTIASKASMAVDVPRLRFTLRNASGAEIYAWTAIPTQSVLEPGKNLPFRSRLASPPPEGHDVQVRFFNRRDAVASGR